MLECRQRLVLCKHKIALFSYCLHDLQYKYYLLAEHMHTNRQNVAS